MKEEGIKKWDKSLKFDWRVGAVNGKESRETWVSFWKIYSKVLLLNFALHAANGKWEFSFCVEACTAVS
jgi:hypothetical protein